VSPVLPVDALAWCTFRVAGGDYGVALARVQEVLRPLPVTRLPLGPPAIAGLINLRGRIVPVVDLRALLRPAGEAGATPAHGGFVVVRTADGPVALLVDAIGDVRRAESANPPALLAPPGATDADGPPLVTSTLAFPGLLLVELDLDRVLERAFTHSHRTRT
jgi:purine-binding chemotaxis protein CheW